MDLYQMFEVLLCSFFVLDHTSSFEIIRARIDDLQNFLEENSKALLYQSMGSAMDC